MGERFISAKELSKKLPFSINNSPKPSFPDLAISPEKIPKTTFSPKDKKILERNGYEILILQGVSISQIRQSGFIKTVPLSAEIEDKHSLSSEVAINLKTNFKYIGRFDNFSLSTLSLSDFYVPDKKLKSGSRKIDTLKKIIPDLTTYCELVYRYYQSTGLPLWTGGNTFKTGYLITSSGPDNQSNYCVGGQPSYDTRLSIYPFKDSKKIVSRLPLIVPSEIYRL